MKRKKIYHIIISASIIFMIVSCKNEYEKQIIGTWFSLTENEKLEFTRDSLFVNNLDKIGTWKANKNNIEYSWLDYFIDSIQISNYNYKLKSDSLIFNTKRDLNQKFIFLKCNSFTEFLMKKNNIDIDLESRSESKVQTENKYSIKVFAKMKNGLLKVKTEYSDNLDYLDNDLMMILDELNPFFTKEYNDLPESFIRNISFENWKKIKFHYLLFVDKNVPNDSIFSITKKLKKSKITKIYQVFKTEENRNHDFSILKTIKL